jgi:hypothetical protein
MKKIEGKWVKPFEFSAKQRSILLKVWPREKDQQNATVYIDQVQRQIEVWLSMVEDVRTSVPQTRTLAIKLSNKIEVLKQTLDELPEDFVSHLDAGVTEKLYTKKYKYEYEMAKEALNAISSSSHSHWYKKEYPSLMEMDEVLNEFLILIQDVAKDMSTLKAPSGQDKGYEKLLVKWLAELYERVFNKIPSSGNGSTFRRLASELSTILGYDLGADIIRELINNRKHSGRYYY